MFLRTLLIIRCLLSPFPAISRRFVISARVGDDILDLCGLLIALTRFVGYECMYVCMYGIAMQVLQYLREFDAPAMQSCKPLPCGTGSCQNRRLREQTLTRKPCHCGSIKGG